MEAIAVGDVGSVEENEEVRMLKAQLHEPESRLQKQEEQYRAFMDEGKQQQGEKEETVRVQKKACWKKPFVMLIIALAIIGGGVGAYLFLSGQHESGDTSLDDTQQAKDDTSQHSDPTVSPAAGMSFSPMSPISGILSDPPTVGPLYDSPTQEDCAFIESGQIPDLSNLTVRTLNITLVILLIEAEDLETIDQEALASELEDNIQKFFIPPLAGRLKGTTENRWLRVDKKQLLDSNTRSSLARQLVVIDPYVVTTGLVNV